MKAWFAGDFEQCLELCDLLDPRGIERISEVALLRARALLRLGGRANALAAREHINAVFVAHETLDASLTAQMLLGSAEVMSGDIDAGVLRLEAARDRAAAAHATIRSEIALRLGLAYYARRELDPAQELLSTVSPESDIVYAAALNCSGWIETARGHESGASLSFIASAQHLMSCRHHDRFLEANNLVALSFLAAEQFDASLWDFITARSARIDWSADGLAEARWWITLSGAYVYEAQGDATGAYAAARRAEEIAPTPGFRAYSLCRRAELARNAGEIIVASDFLACARAVFDAIAPESLAGDERAVALDLAAELARRGDVADARAYLHLYRSLETMNGSKAMSADPRGDAHERLVEAMVADAAGETSQARRLYGAAFRAFDAVGYLRRATAAALRLAQITAHDRYFAYVVERVANTSPDYYVRRAVAPRERYYSDPVIAALSPSEREVLDLVCRGYSNGEIARDRDRSINTIKHTVSRLLDAFDVHGRVELKIAASRRLQIQ